MRPMTGERARVPAMLGPMLVALMLEGCAGSLFKTDVAPPTMYLLSAESPPAASAVHAAAANAAPANAAPAAGAPGSAPRGDLAVLRPRVRAGLDTERIAALYPDRHLDYFADVRWSGPLDEVIENLAVQLFHSVPGLADVSGDASAFASEYWLEIEVADFQAEYANDAARGVSAPPSVRVHLLARLGSSGDRIIMARFEAQAVRPASSNRMSAIVDAYNGAANQALMQIAADCAATLAESMARHEP